MCTAITFQNGDFYLGRTLDLDRSFGEAVVLTPRQYPLPSPFLGTLPVQYALIGMAHVARAYPLYAEAVNEKGLCMAGLYFPGNACYVPPAQAKGLPVAPYELIPYVLGRCGTREEARALLAGIDLVDQPFSPQLPLAPLHWLVSDASGSLTVERTAVGLQIYDNPLGVLTNNPPFPFYQEYVRQFLALSPQEPSQPFPRFPLTPSGLGTGAVGLPGDFSPSARFLRALFCRDSSQCPRGEAASVSQVFHLLEAVSMPQGAVRNGQGRPERTLYSCCLNATRGLYYYRTYENSQITQISLTQAGQTQAGLARFPLRRTQHIWTEPQA